jgi:hypothetical protein
LWQAGDVQVRAAFGLLVVVVAACSAPVSVTLPPKATASPAGSPAASEPAATGTLADQIEGDWHRAQTCEEMLAAFEAAGLAETHRMWLQGNFFDEGTAPTTGDPCAGATGPLEHAHFFNPDGAFGSYDQEGNQVDDGDWLLDGTKLAFPSHSEEFGYDQPVEVGFTINEAGDVVTFDVTLPDGCTGACADAYAWALSAFASGPWSRGGIP